jgi:hypothetical protein
MLTKRELLQDAVLAAITVAATKSAPVLAQPSTNRDFFIETRDIAAPSAFGIPASITTPDRVESRIGMLEFKDGAPSQDTLAKVYDNLDFTHAFEAFVNTLQVVNMQACRKGFVDAGVKDNEVLVFSDFMDSKTLLLTGNADTVYVMGFLDLTKGPMVLEVAPGLLGAIDDIWYRWVIDLGLPGPDRGLGGKYLIVPPGYDGPLPEGGFFMAHAQTTRVVWFGRMFLEHNSPKPAAEVIRKLTKVYQYDTGGVGTPLADFLSGRVRLGRVAPPPETVFHEGSGKAINTVPPNDFSFFEMLNEVVQQEAATSLGLELMGPLAAIGIVKGKPFAPDARMKTILTEAVAVGNATARCLFMNPRDESWAYYSGSAWVSPLFVSGYDFETPIPIIEGPVRDGQRIPEGVKPFPKTGYRTLDARTFYFYSNVAMSPALAMRMTGVGSQYLYGTRDANKQYLDGAKTYRVRLPKGIPAANFWSLTLYDNQSRSMLDTPQRYPRAGSQSYPSPAAEPDADGSTTVYFGPIQPDGIKRGNWIQTVPEKGYFVLLRLYSPLEPFFDKTWRPSEVELV